MSYDINPTNGSKVIGAVIITRYVAGLENRSNRLC